MSLRLTLPKLVELLKECLHSIEFYEEIIEGISANKDNPSAIEELLNQDYSEWKTEKGYE